MNPSSFLPFTRPWIDEATIAGVGEVLRSGMITTGTQARALEDALGQLFGGRAVRVFNSATAALEIALRLAKVGAGDEVITTPLSWVATANVILQVGATPCFVDIDPATRNINLQQVKAAINSRTKALMPVDLAGLPVPRTTLYAIAQEHGLRVIEDAAQSIGASWDNELIGAKGDFISLSFHPNKNITSIEGGALVLPPDIDPGLCERYRLQGVLRGPWDQMEVDVLGGKSNLTDVAARVALGQLPYLEEWTQKRRSLARCYFDHFDTELGCELPVMDMLNSNWHMYQIVLPKQIVRSDFMAGLHEKGIGTGVHYPAIHLFKLYLERGFRPGMFPHAERIGRQIVTLPLFPRMSQDDVLRVCETSAEVIRKLGKLPHAIS